MQSAHIERDQTRPTVKAVVANGTYRELRPLTAVVTVAIAPKSSAVADTYAIDNSFTTILTVTAQGTNGKLGTITTIVTLTIARGETALVAVVVAGRINDSWGRWWMRRMWHGGVRVAS